MGMLGFVTETDWSQESFYGNNTMGVIWFVIYISGAEFEEHCFNISRDILYSVFFHCSCTPNDIITFLICIIQKRQHL